MLVFLPFVGGLVEGVMVDGSIDKIKENTFTNKKNIYIFIIITFTIQEKNQECHFFYSW